MKTLSKSLYRQTRALISSAVEGRKEYRRLQAAMTDLLLMAAANRDIDSLLDVGCGKGGYTLNNAQALGVSLNNVYGVEFNPHHLKVAQEHFMACSVDLEQSELPFDDGSMDLVICNQVLEHIKNVFWILAEMDRVLSIGGILAIGIPNLTSLINRPQLLLGRQPVTIGIEGPHVRGFAHTSFREFLLRHKGYRLVAEIGSSLYPWPAKLGAERMARRLPGLSAYTFYALVKQETISPCPWLRFGTDGETSYTHALRT